jgi:hypothetical protein
MIDRCFIKGWARTIECDGLRYPTFESVEYAIKNGEALISPWICNITPSVGKYAIIRRLVNAASLSNESIITYGAVGTGSSTPLITNTTLDTELFRKQLAQRTYSGATATFRMFMTTSEGNGTLAEYGLFGEAASGTADSGTMFQRLIISKTKTTAKTLTIESKIEIL